MASNRSTKPSRSKPGSTSNQKTASKRVLPKGPKTKIRRRRPTRFQILIRRTVALIILLLLAVGLVFLGKFIWEFATKSEETPAAPAGDTTLPISQCVAGTLSLSAEPSGAELPAAEPMSFTVTVRNTGEVPCVTGGAANVLGVRVVSGQESMWNSLECAGTPDAKPLLLDVDQEWSTVIEWDGNAYGEGCTLVRPTLPGTYRVSAATDEVITLEERVFVLY